MLDPEPNSAYLAIHAQKVEGRSEDELRKEIQLTAGQAKDAGVRVSYYDGPMMDGLVIAFTTDIADEDITKDDLTEKAWLRVNRGQAWAKVDSAIPFNDTENCPNYIVHNTKEETPLFKALVRHYIKMLWASKESK